jgi:hypothetical protein
MLCSGAGTHTILYYKLVLRDHKMLYATTELQLMLILMLVLNIYIQLNASCTKFKYLHYS